MGNALPKVRRVSGRSLRLPPERRYRPVARPIRHVVLNATCSKLQFLEKWFRSKKTQFLRTATKYIKSFPKYQKKKKFYYYFLKELFSILFRSLHYSLSLSC